MKKSFVVLAALAACGTVFAQSSVTLYGVADLSLAKVTGSSVQMAGASPLTNGTSRFGLRGTEDLGDGLKASFNFEAELNLETGATAAATFARAANMTLGGGFGTLKLGRTLTPSYYGVVAWELTGAANYTVVNSQFGYVGLSSRHNSEISYTSPSFSGFSFTLGQLLKGDNANVGKTDLNLIYKNGPLAVSLAYNKLENTPKNYALGAAYDFGSVRLAGSVQDATGAGKGKGFTLGGSVPIGAVTLIADVARDTQNKDTDYLLEARYALSKRTFVYGAFQHNGKGKAVKDVDSTMVGIRHNF
jgi:predicted porin